MAAILNFKMATNVQVCLDGRVDFLFHFHRYIQYVRRNFQHSFSNYVHGFCNLATILYIYILEISPASRDIISSVIHVGVLGVVGCAWHCGMCLAFLEIFSVHIHKVYGQIKSFGWGGGGGAYLTPCNPHMN